MFLALRSLAAVRDGGVPGREGKYRGSALGFRAFGQRASKVAVGDYACRSETKSSAVLKILMRKP